ncbi:MAG: SusE domain-containing protein [Bacteroidales bacterium]|nr:SusE domain-containing protein [Bacteroidales bacterium]
MKNNLIIVVLVALFFVYSCDKKELGPTLELINAPVLLEPENTTFTLSNDIAKDTILTLKWQKAVYNVPTEITYDVEMAEAGTNFANPIAIVSGISDDSVGITAFTLNKFMTVDLQLAVGEECQVEFRVNSFVGESDASLSNAVGISAVTFDPPYTPLTFTIMSGDTEIKVLNLLDDFVGDATLDVDQKGMYEGYVWLTADNLSITFLGGQDLVLNRDPKTLGSDSSKIVGQVTTHFLSETAVDPITVDSVGYYRFKIDMNESTVEVMGVAWGVIGSGIEPFDWSTSIVMDYSIDDDIWSVEVTTHDGEFKFRPNQTWDPLNYGDQNNDGTLNEYGTNIPIEAGTKFITLKLSEFPYEFSVQNAKK